jgi:hypothetical protein
MIDKYFAPDYHLTHQEKTFTTIFCAFHQCALKRFLISKSLDEDVQITQQECHIGLFPVLQCKFLAIL